MRTVKCYFSIFSLSVKRNIARTKVSTVAIKGYGATSSSRHVLLRFCHTVNLFCTLRSSIFINSVKVIHPGVFVPLVLQQREPCPFRARSALLLCERVHPLLSFTSLNFLIAVVLPFSFLFEEKGRISMIINHE